MYRLILCLFFFTFALQTESKVHIDVKELRCLVCKATIDELDIQVKRIDPNRKIEIGSYRIDSTGNAKQKIISEAKSEVHLSELADKVCSKMDDYIRATWKDSGKLTILKLITENGQMNTDMSLVDVIQDDDLNKSLQYYCEGVMEEHEDSIIDHFKNESDNIAYEVCTREANYCTDTYPESDSDESHTNEEL